MLTARDRKKYIAREEKFKINFKINFDFYATIFLCAVESVLGYYGTVVNWNSDGGLAVSFLVVGWIIAITLLLIFCFFWISNVCEHREKVKAIHKRLDDWERCVQGGVTGPHEPKKDWQIWWPEFTSSPSPSDPHTMVAHFYRWSTPPKSSPGWSCIDYVSGPQQTYPANISTETLAAAWADFVLAIFKQNKASYDEYIRAEEAAQEAVVNINSVNELPTATEIMRGLG